jgi:uncharacterized membrane protein YgdD (TMEM256/DUF423 family)
MPNTLAHVGAQGLTSRTALSDVDLKWVYLGCVIPDLPWILQRAAHVVVPGIDPFVLRSYVIIQASLLGCLVFSGAVALLARKVWRIFAVLGGNAVLHLGLDAMQTKWGNGVHFFAPFSWEITNWGLFWPESTPTYVLTALGLLYIAWHWQSSVSEPPGFTWPGIPRLVGILVFLGSYFLGPLYLHQQPIRANAHSLETLSEPSGRAGRPVEMDRAGYVRGQDGYFLVKFGERVQVEKLDIPAPVTVSIQGVFTDESTVHVTEVHAHADGVRDYASYLGFGLIILVWLIALAKNNLFYGYAEKN